MKKARILLADDHALMLDGLSGLLRHRYSVIGAVRDGKALVEAAICLRPELVILDVTMPGLSGIDAAREIRKRVPETKLLFLTMHTSPSYLHAALEAGANGYALKSSGRGEILAAVESVLAGSRYIAPSAEGPGPGLSARERQILQLIAEGKSRKEVAFALGISEKTVAFHRNHLTQKLGLRTTAQLTRYALEHGLIS